MLLRCHDDVAGASSGGVARAPSVGGQRNATCEARSVGGRTSAQRWDSSGSGSSMDEHAVSPAALDGEGGGE